MDTATRKIRNIIRCGNADHQFFLKHCMTSNSKRGKGDQQGDFLWRYGQLAATKNIAIHFILRQIVALVGKNGENVQKTL